jgi:hypothetical protein
MVCCRPVIRSQSRGQLLVSPPPLSECLLGIPIRRLDYLLLPLHILSCVYRIHDKEILPTSAPHNVASTPIMPTTRHPRDPSHARLGDILRRPRGPDAASTARLGQ